MGDLERPLDATGLDVELTSSDGADFAGAVGEDVDDASHVFIFLKGLTCGRCKVCPSALRTCSGLARCPWCAVSLDDLVALGPVGADGVALVSSVLAEVELVLGDGEVVLSVVNDLVDVGIVPDETVVREVDRPDDERLLGLICTRTSYLGDVEAVAVVTQDV